MKKILIVWSGSKLASKFIKNYEKKLSLLKTFNHFDINKWYYLNLDDLDSINKFITDINTHKFDWILVFSSVYKIDDLNILEDLYSQLNINCINLIYLLEKIIKNWNLNEKSKIFFFTDWWTIQPKKWFISYNISKDLLKSCIKSLSIKYMDYIFLWIDLWPVDSPKKWNERKEFFEKALVNIKDPSLWLIRLLYFLIKEKNFYSTWSIIDFTWWTYLKRK